MALQNGKGRMEYILVPLAKSTIDQLFFMVTTVLHYCLSYDIRVWWQDKLTQKNYYTYIHYYQRNHFTYNKISLSKKSTKCTIHYKRRNIWYTNQQVHKIIRVILDVHAGTRQKVGIHALWRKEERVARREGGREVGECLTYIYLYRDGETSTHLYSITSTETGQPTWGTKIRTKIRQRYQEDQECQ